MKVEINPCYQCICSPICRQKHWASVIVQCRTLSFFMKEGPYVRWKFFVDQLKTKEFFNIQFWNKKPKNTSKKGDDHVHLFRK